MSDGNGQAPASRLDLIRDELKDAKIKQSKIKLREWGDLEELVGRNVNEHIGSDYPPIWFMQGVLWLWLRRKHPQLTYADFGEVDLELLFEVTKRSQEDDADPTPASGGSPPSPASATSGG